MLTREDDVDDSERPEGRCRPVASPLMSAARVGGTCAVLAALCVSCNSNSATKALATSSPNSSMTASPSPSNGPASSGQTTVSPTRSTSTATVASKPAQVTKQCLLTQLSLSTQSTSGGTGHAGLTLVFTNHGATCTLEGFPGVDEVGSGGGVAASAKRTLKGYLGGAAQTVVTLAHGRAASALLEGQSGQARGGPACPSYTAYLITPPHETHSFHRANNAIICDAEIHPVVSGSAGGANAH